MVGYCFGSESRIVLRLQAVETEWRLGRQYYNAPRGRGRKDILPTVYAANTPQALRSHAEASGLELVDVSLIEGRPECLRR